MRMAPALACSCWFLLLLSTTYAAPWMDDQRVVWPAPVAGEEPLCRGGHHGRDCCAALHAMGRGWTCKEGEGDCDSDAECSPGLKCGSGNCRGLGFDSTDDCCYDPRQTVQGQGGRCDGGDSCCSGGGQCSLGEGDCDDDRECSQGLVCGTDNCQGAGFDSTDDCCRQRCYGGDTCCTEQNACREGEGDCDQDSDCAPGLRCGTDNCQGLGFDSTDDCCYDPRLNPHDLLDQSDREPRQFLGSHGHQDGPSSWLEHSHQGGLHFHVQEPNAEHRHINVLGQTVEHTHAAGGLGHIHRPFGVLVGGQGGRCDGGDSCCSGGGQCSLGEGDCDDDRECSSGLVCGTDNCLGAGFDSTDDCCRQRCGGGDTCCTRANQCSLGEGDCDEDIDCRLGLICGRDNCRGQGFDGTDDCCRQRCEGGDSCCTALNMCREGEGDCDQDSDCAPGLRCGRDNCQGPGFDSTDDCCEALGP